MEIGGLGVLQNLATEYRYLQVLRTGGFLCWLGVVTWVQAVLSQVWYLNNWHCDMSADFLESQEDYGLVCSCLHDCGYVMSIYWISFIQPHSGPCVY